MFNLHHATAIIGSRSFWFRQARCKRHDGQKIWKQSYVHSYVTNVTHYNMHTAKKQKKLL